MSVILVESDEGTKQKVMRKVEEYDKKIDDALRQKLDKVWDKVLWDAIMECPIVTATLASTIRIVEGAFGGLMGGHIAGRMVFDRTITAGDEMVTKPDGTPCIYAQWVHDGYVHPKSGRFVVGHPFLEIALEMNMPELEKAIEEAFNERDKIFGED